MSKVEAIASQPQTPHHILHVHPAPAPPRRREVTSTPASRPPPQPRTACRKPLCTVSRKRPSQLPRLFSWIPWGGINAPLNREQRSHSAPRGGPCRLDRWSADKSTALGIRITHCNGHSDNSGRAYAEPGRESGPHSTAEQCRMPLRHSWTAQPHTRPAAPVQCRSFNWAKQVHMFRSILYLRTGPRACPACPD